METQFFGNKKAETIFIQAVDDHDLSLMESELAGIRDLAGTSDFLLAAVVTDDWNSQLSPWNAPSVFGNENFGNGAADTLHYIEKTVVRPISEASGGNLKFYIGGYSLAGLFALWAGYQTNLFGGIAAVSPSVWFPGFREYAADRRIQTQSVYLSLGKKEEKTRNPVMAQVGDSIRAIHANLEETGVHTTLEWNEGNHFRDSDKRTAKGFAWLMRASCGSHQTARH